MTGNEYQRLAARTMNGQMVEYDQELHALFGMASEVGEIHSLYQHMLQHMTFGPDEEALKKEIGDLLWFIAELCTVKTWNLDDIMQANIDKLRARYPEGFDIERSVNRHAYDVQDPAEE